MVRFSITYTAPVPPWRALHEAKPSTCGCWRSQVLTWLLIIGRLPSRRARPKLAITPAGLVVRGWFSTQTYTQADLKSVRITEFRRLTRKVRLLELDTVDDRLLVFTRWDVGTDPINVLDALTDAGLIP